MKTLSFALALTLSSFAAQSAEIICNDFKGREVIRMDYTGDILFYEFPTLQEFQQNSKKYLPKINSLSINYTVGLTCGEYNSRIHETLNFTAVEAKVKKTLWVKSDAADVFAKNWRIELPELHSVCNGGKWSLEFRDILMSDTYRGVTTIRGTNLENEEEGGFGHATFSTGADNTRLLCKVGTDS